MKIIKLLDPKTIFNRIRSKDKEAYHSQNNFLVNFNNKKKIKIAIKIILIWIYNCKTDY